MPGLPCFAHAASNDLAPASAPAAVLSVCPHGVGGQPAACLLAEACQRLWLHSVDDGCGSSLMLGMSSSLVLQPPRRWQSQKQPRGHLRTVMVRCIVSAASDPTVTSRAGADRLLRTEPQVRFLYGGFITNNCIEQPHVADTKTDTKRVKASRNE